MVSVKKSHFKRILIIIITVLLVFSIVSLAATKIIYDSIFARFDCGGHTFGDEFTEIISTRQTVTYASGKNELTGQLYKNDNDRYDTLIVIAPGFNACADSYLNQIKSLLGLGWSVFIFDVTGSGKSGGDSTVGFPQEINDLDSTLKYIENNDRFGYNNIVLMGHSRGGYAVGCALGLGYDISAAVTISGINSAMEGVIGSAKRYVGPLAYGNYGFLWLYQTMLFGAETTNMRAAEEISKSDVATLIIHGADDRIVPIDKFSLYAHKDEIENKNAVYHICRSPESDGHTDLLYDTDGSANDELMEIINKFLLENIK